MSDLSWSEIGEKVDGMFSQDHGRLTRRPVHFYGNDGVCLFKYFVRTDDARKNRESLRADTGMISTQKDPVVWTMLIVNLICFMIITGCYIKIIRHTKKSTQNSGQYDNCDRLRENRTMHYRIMVIIATDFLCWVPFIFISALHNLGKIDATSWYINFAMIVLPLNSVINPLIYDKSLVELIQRRFVGASEAIRLVLNLGLAIITRLLQSGHENLDGEPEVIAMETFRVEDDFEDEVN